MENTYFHRHNPIVRKIFLALLVPTILMNLTTSIASMADTMIIGRYLDDASLSVVTFATPIYLIINVCSALFAVGGCIAMSIDSGKGNRDAANKAFSTAVELLALTGMALLAAGLFFSRRITGWLGAGEDVFDMVQTYAKIVMLGAPVFTLNTGLAFFVRNDGRPTLSMVGMFTSITVDIVLNFVFVGMMGMGVAGAAYSTVMGHIVGLAILCTHFFSKKNTLRFHPVCDGMVIRIVKNGGSAALQFVYQFLCVLIINRLLAKLAGTNGVVMYTVVFNLSTVALSMFEGISQTIQPMVSNYYGEKSYRNIRATMRLAFISIIAICGSVTLLLEMYPKLVPVLFGIEDSGLIAQSAVAVRIYAVSMVITTLNVVIGYYLQSTEQNSMAAVIISLRSFVLLLGAVFLLGKMLGINGIWAAYTVAEALTLVICLLMIRHKRAKMLQDGVRANAFLLDADVEAGIECYTCNCVKDDFAAFRQEICICLPAGAYLSHLEGCMNGKNGSYVEVEINRMAGKAYIRDNLKHGTLPRHILDASGKAEYGPVLGWNRLCMEIDGE